MLGFYQGAPGLHEPTNSIQYMAPRTDTGMSAWLAISHYEGKDDKKPYESIGRLTNTAEKPYLTLAPNLAQDRYARKESFNPSYKL